MSAAVDAFFESYRCEYERADALAITSHFAFPLQVTSDTGGSGPGEIVLTHVASRDEWTRQVDRLLAAYARVGVASARIADLTTFELTPRLFQAVVEWELRDSEGDRLYRFDAAYTLAEVDGSLHITALVHNEFPRLQALLARLRQHG